MELWSVATAAMIIAVTIACGTVATLYLYWKCLKEMFKD